MTDKSLKTLKEMAEHCIKMHCGLMFKKQDINALLDEVGKDYGEAKFIYPKNGYDSDRKTAKKYLEVGKSYAIEKIEVGDFNTKVWLKEFPNIYFNSVLFDLPTEPKTCESCGNFNIQTPCEHCYTRERWKPKVYKIEAIHALELLKARNEGREEYKKLFDELLEAVNKLKGE